MKKIITPIIVLALVFSFCTVGAHAADYTFQAKNNDDFYRSTLYEDMYGSEYNYGGPNVTDFYDTSILPGLVSPTPQTADSGNVIPGAPLDYGIYDTGYGVYDSYPSGLISATTSWKTSFTPVSELKRSDGSIGTLSIPSLSINMKVYEGTGSDSLNKGVGHFPETSGWLGNIVLCGHNRGAAYTIGSIKNLKIGDIIEYSTVLGKKKYSVSFVGTISSTDWSYVSATADNRITLITCLANQPSLRICVQGTEIR